MIRRPPRSTLDRSSAASDVYKRQGLGLGYQDLPQMYDQYGREQANAILGTIMTKIFPVSYTHLRAHETVLDLVCRLLLEKKTSTDTTASLICITSNRQNTTLTQAHTYEPD